MVEDIEKVSSASGLGSGPAVHRLSWETRFAEESGFELSGVASEIEPSDFKRYQDWVDDGCAGAMGYLTDRRAEMRRDLRTLLPSVQSVICVGKLYNGPEPYSTEFGDSERAWISRYAWGEDYHHVMRRGLEHLAERLIEIYGPMEWRACVDTAPVLERSLARAAGLGWIGKNTCLIHQGAGSWFFLGELLTSLPFGASAATADDRCGTCTRCIEACPTEALVTDGWGSWQLDARRCISYLTIELHGEIDPELRPLSGNHVFGCDICQDVCPWNRRSPQTGEPAFAPREFAPPLEKLAALTETEFRNLYRDMPIARARYCGFLRNVAVAMGNSQSEKMREPLRRLAESSDELVAEHARTALRKLETEIAACG